MARPGLFDARGVRREGMAWGRQTDRQTTTKHTHTHTHTHLLEKRPKGGCLLACPRFLRLRHPAKATTRGYWDRVGVKHTRTTALWCLGALSAFDVTATTTTMMTTMTPLFLLPPTRKRSDRAARRGRRKREEKRESNSCAGPPLLAGWLGVTTAPRRESEHLAKTTPVWVMVCALRTLVHSLFSLTIAGGGGDCCDVSRCSSFLVCRAARCGRGRGREAGAPVRQRHRLFLYCVSSGVTWVAILSSRAATTSSSRPALQSVLLLQSTPPRGHRFLS